MTLDISRTKDGGIRILALVGPHELEKYRSALRVVGVDIDPQPKPIDIDTDGHSSPSFQGPES